MHYSIDLLKAPKKKKKKTANKTLRPKNYKSGSSSLYHIENKEKMRTDSVDSDDTAHYEPLRLNLRCLQLQLFTFGIVVKRGIFSRVHFVL